MNKPLAPANESLISFLRLGSDMVNRKEFDRQKMTSRPASQNVLMDNSITIRTITLRAKHYINLAGFYKTVIGLEVLQHDEQSRMILMGRNRKPLVRIIDGSSLPDNNKEEPGLFHFAFLYQHDSALASALLRVSYYNPELYRGSADNGVSVSFYLEDTEGNGIELYADRNPNTWKWRGDNIQVNPKEIEYSDFIRWRFNPILDEQWDKQHIEIGHVHLQGGSIKTADVFYNKLLGFSKTLDLPSVSFYSTGGYHQHFSVNTWNCRNVPASTRTCGAESIDVGYCDENYMSALQRNIKNTSFTHWSNNNGDFCINDPLTNIILIFKKETARFSAATVIEQNPEQIIV